MFVGCYACCCCAAEFTSDAVAAHTGSVETVVKIDIDKGGEDPGRDTVGQDESGARPLPYDYAKNQKANDDAAQEGVEALGVAARASAVGTVQKKGEDLTGKKGGADLQVVTQVSRWMTS